ncbi:MAG: SDR family NAD(P)-dependent oxidoreductase [Gammaproteobacteria bacterium]|jgi:uncharacterized oxidoreductase
MQKTVLVTGATRGLGLSLARAYRQQGHDVVGLARDAAALESLKREEILCDAITCDLADTNQIDSALLEFQNRYERLHVLVHNAALQSAYGIHESPQYARMVQREMSVNFMAAVQLTAGLLSPLLEGKGEIVVISSLLQRVSKPAAPGYSASKSALASWTANLRHQLRDHGIGVCEVIPGLIRTDMSPEGKANGSDPDELAGIISRRLPRRRLVLPGARVGWFIGSIAPGVLQGILNRK